MKAEPAVLTPSKKTRVLQWLASPRWMLAFFVFAAISALVSAKQPDWITGAWALPLAIFIVSLLAAVATNARFRRDPALLGLHLGLLVFVVLIAFAWLTYLDGAVTLTQGTAFEGQLHLDRRGLFHPGGIERLRFTNDGFTENFDPRASSTATYNRVHWTDANGTGRAAEIGDDHPLVMGGYRIYTSRNRGYSPVFRWQPIQGAEEVGTVQLRAGEFDMANNWQLPGGPEIWAKLDLPQPVKLLPGQRRSNLGTTRLTHKLVVRIGARREVLQPGESIELPEGRLTYDSLDSWMGYRIVYDMAMYWMIAAAAVVVGCMITFYARLLKRGWTETAMGEEPCD
jgi:hypothetical protein